MLHWLKMGSCKQTHHTQKHVQKRVCKIIIKKRLCKFIQVKANHWDSFLRLWGGGTSALLLCLRERLRSYNPVFFYFPHYILYIL